MNWNDPWATAYYFQMRKALRRGIEWLFDFDSWCKVWRDSGKWEQRGRGRGKFVMSRPGDCGPYSPSNVRIIAFEDNCRERQQFNPSEPPPSQLGRGRGWSLCRRPELKKPFHAARAGKSLGYYATAEEAEAASAAFVHQRLAGAA